MPRPSALKPSSSPAVTDTGIVYFGDHSGAVTALDGDGTLLIGSEDGYLYAIHN